MLTQRNYFGQLFHLFKCARAAQGHKNRHNPEHNLCDVSLLPALVIEIVSALAASVIAAPVVDSLRPARSHCQSHFVMPPFYLFSLFWLGALLLALAKCMLFAALLLIWIKYNHLLRACILSVSTFKAFRNLNPTQPQASLCMRCSNKVAYTQYATL